MQIGTKILILGCPGSGKSTLARKLRRYTGLPLIYLDQLWWKPDRTHVAQEDFDRKLSQILAGDAWIIDGNYRRTYEVRIRACNTIFFLDYDSAECMQGIEARIGTARPDMPWIESEIDPELVEIVRSYRDVQRPVLLSLFEKYPGKRVLAFRSRRETDAWLTAAFSEPCL